MKKTIIFISLIVTSALILSACTKPVVSEEPVQTEQAPGIAPAGPAEGVPVNEEPVSKAASTADPSKYTAGSPEHYMATRGFDPEALRVYWDDYYEINDERLILHTDGNLSEVAKALYNETAKASDDGYVLDYWSEEPVEFKTLNEGEMYIFGYKKDGEFRFVCLSPVIKYQFLLQWDK